MAQLKFYKCEHCGNVIIKAYDAGAPVSCCGEPMVELKANSTDAAQEKHVPDVTITDTGCTVKVGEVEHPMTEEHMIRFIVMDKGCAWYIKPLDSGKPAQAIFDCKPSEIKRVYEYCNLHGLWVKEL